MKPPSNLAGISLDRQQPSLLAMEVREEELQELYLWVDSIPLSRPKKNIGRDFSDGGEHQPRNCLQNPPPPPPPPGTCTPASQTTTFLMASSPPTQCSWRRLSTTSFLA